jgi:chaperonin GroES
MINFTRLNMSLSTFDKVAFFNNKIINKQRSIMNFQPLGKRVLVKRVEEATTTASGIIIPDNAKEKPSRGEVVAVSKEVTELACGNKVLFGKYSGNEVSFEGEKFLVIELDDIFGIIG